MRILVYEHVSGGGFAGKPVSTSVLSEGYAMLRVATSGFKAVGHSVTALLDSRIAAFNPFLDADRIIPLPSSGDAESAVRTAADSADAALVIAPESNCMLQSFVATVERTSAVSLNSKSSAIGKVADKTAFLGRVKELGLTVPETLLLDSRNDVEEIVRNVRGKLELPLVVKPANGEACSGLSLVESEGDLVAAVKKAVREAPREQVLVQEFISGVPASVSLFSTGNEAVAISLNWQDIDLGTPKSASSYEGGLVPLESSFRAEAFAVAEKVVESFGDLTGYVGVDMVLTEDKPVLMEVNPRLTTSAVGLSRVVNFNLSQAVLGAVLKRELPLNAQCRGCAFFSKVAVPKQVAGACGETYAMSEVASPPFPLAQDGSAHALLSTCGGGLHEALLKFREAKKRLRHICEGGRQL